MPACHKYLQSELQQELPALLLGGLKPPVVASHRGLELRVDGQRGGAAGGRGAQQQLHLEFSWAYQKLLQMYEIGMCHSS